MTHSKRSDIRQGFIFYLMAVAVLAIILFTYIFNGASTEVMTALGWTYFAASCLTHSAILLLPAFLLFQLLPTLLGCHRRWINLPVSLFYGIIFILAVANNYVYNIYHFHINGLVLEMLTGPGASEIFVFPPLLYAKAIALSLLLMATPFLLWWLSVRVNNRLSHAHIYKYSLPALLATAVFSQAAHVYGAATMNAAIVESTDAVPYYFPLRANKLLVKMGIIDQSTLSQLRFKSSGSTVVYPLLPLKVKQPDEQLNIVLLCIDSWNPRTMTKACTPHIHDFAQQAEQYTHHLSSSNGTRGGLFGMFTGLPAYYWKSFEYANIQPLFIEQLLKAGYKVQAYPSATFENPPFAKMFFGNVKGLNINTPGDTPYQRDLRINSDFLADLDRYDGRQPFFSFVFYDAAHAIEVPKNKQFHFQPSWEYIDYMKLNNDIDPTPAFNLYRNCVAEIDSLIGLTLDKLKQKDLLRNTVVIITGDHGQEFNENHCNYWGHSSNYSQWQIHVPLIYYYPGCKPALRHHRTTHYDLSPTLLHQVLGVQNPPSDLSMGHYLHDTAPRDWHLTGNDLYYAFTLLDGTIVEKHGTGRLKILDKHMKPTPDYPLNARKLQEAIHNMNRFFK
ncbi:sulfatase-like hydrolase/transferase [Prevotella sp.]|uniref:sulfatase-like hydrolase/transferase n=1 Tax=Prevotella sp. TaxID=59823 RepID=UPI002F945012